MQTEEKPKPLYDCKRISRRGRCKDIRIPCADVLELRHGICYDYEPVESRRKVAASQCAHYFGEMGCCTLYVSDDPNSCKCKIAHGKPCANFRRREE